MPKWRVVFDTNTVVSALLFRGAVSWLVDHWLARQSAAFSPNGQTLASGDLDGNLILWDVSNPGHN